MLVIGMISGTSADAIEAVLCEIEGAPPQLNASVVEAISVPFPRRLQQRIHDAATVEGSDVELICLLNAEIGEHFAAAAVELISAAGREPSDVDLVGSHGQTIWHAVGPDGGISGTLQIGNASYVAERTGITTVGDLRTRDVAAGGQGAPIVAYVDWLLLRHADRYRAVQNLGGIGNVAYLPPVSDSSTAPLAFDTGPANVLIDVVMTLLTDGRQAYDRDGALAARGSVDEDWITALLTLPYYERRPPKTTGRELYSPAMGAELLAQGRARGLSDEDVVATLTAYAADTVVDQYARFLPVPPDEVIVAGGGTRNPSLLVRLAERLPEGTRLMTLEDVGYASQQKEAIAMAVLAYETWHGRPGTLPAFTGVSHPVIMGSITPGRLSMSPPQPSPAHAGTTTAVAAQPTAGAPETMTTEAVEPRWARLDTMSSLQIVELMNEQDSTVPAAVRPALPAIAAAVDAIVERLQRGGRLLYAGAGTSGRLAMLDAVECVPTFSVSPRLVTALVAGGEGALTMSIEGAEDDTDLARWDVAEVEVGEDDAFVGIAASGSTPYVVAALEAARARGAVTVAVANNEPAPILDVADHRIVALTGPEVVSGSTRLKAGTAQKLVLNMLSTATMVRLGKVHGNRMIDVSVSNRKLRDRAEGIVADLVGCNPETAVRLLDAAEGEVKTAVLMGLAGIDAPTARGRLEAAGGVLARALEGA